MTNIVTKESIQSMLDNPNHNYVMQVIGRALVGLYKRQTESEQIDNTTKIHNNIGFAGCDAKSGSLTAKYFLKHNKLEQWMIDNWTRRGTKGYSRLCKYHSQLNEIAINKQTR